MSYVPPPVLAEFSWGWDALVAIGTLGLAAVTGWLAWSTRSLAVASRKDERAQWRPVLVPELPAEVAYDDETGAMSFGVRNVGRGPAFGVNAQIRSGKRPLGASVPGVGDATALVPGETFQMHGHIGDPSQRVRGLAVEAEISYYDITERWNRSIFTIVGRRPPDKHDDYSVAPQLEVVKVFVYETDRDLAPVLGPPKALEEQARQQRNWLHRGRSVAARALDRWNRTDR